jgi:hypothetical protein
LGIKELLTRVKEGIKNWPENLRNAILDYQEGYSARIWGFVMVFFVTASLVLIFYVPRFQILRR